MASTTDHDTGNFHVDETAPPVTDDPMDETPTGNIDDEEHDESIPTNLKPKKQRIFEKTGPQASVAQIRDLRLLTQFVKDFDLNIKQREIDEYLGFKERTSRRLRKQKTKSELVAEGKLERHPRADNAKKALKVKAEKRKKTGEDASAEPIDVDATMQGQEQVQQSAIDPALPNGYVEDWQMQNQLQHTFDATAYHHTQT